MNDARKRRPLIRERAAQSRMAAHKKNIKRLCEHGGPFAGQYCKKCHPVVELKKKTYRGWVYLKDAYEHRHVIVDLPAEDIQQTIHKMYMYGFWAKLGCDSKHEGVTWIPPHEIRRINFWMEDNAE